MGLPGGQYTAIYKPHIKLGTLDIRVTINDMAGAEIDSRHTTAAVHSGNQVEATVVFGASVDAGDDLGSSPPMGNGGTAAGEGGEAEPPDGSAPDAPGGDAPAACATMACSGATADACCPAACTSLTDVDCAGCGNGKIDPGETCDPVAACKTECPPMGCQLQT